MIDVDRIVSEANRIAQPLYEEYNRTKVNINLLERDLLILQTGVDSAVHLKEARKKSTPCFIRYISSFRVAEYVFAVGESKDVVEELVAGDNEVTIYKTRSIKRALVYYFQWLEEFSSKDQSDYKQNEKNGYDLYKKLEAAQESAGRIRDVALNAESEIEKLKKAAAALSRKKPKTERRVQQIVEQYQQETKPTTEI